MPIVKFKLDYIYIPYYNFVFKNDIVRVGDSLWIVEKVIFEGGLIKIKPFNENQFYSSRMLNFYFVKRPFLNWLKYLLALIIKRYMK